MPPWTNLQQLVVETPMIAEGSALGAGLTIPGLLATPSPLLG